MSISTVWTEFKAWWEGTTIGQEIDAAAAAALKELEVLAPSILLSVTESTASPILAGLTAGNSTAEIISAGISAAEAAFASAGSSVASTTVSTFVSTLHNSISAQVSAGAVTPTTV